MNTIRLSSKGQVVLPAALRAARAWSPGTEFELLETAEGLLLKPLAPRSAFAPTQLQDVFGMARYQGPVLSVEDMHAAVQAEAARRR
jgi:AbrB family looped-hinge helix DNA binding protein